MLHSVLNLYSKLDNREGLRQSVFNDRPAIKSILSATYLPADEELREEKCSPVFGAKLDSQGSTAVHVTLPERLPHGPSHAHHSGYDRARSRGNTRRTIKDGSQETRLFSCSMVLDQAQFLNLDLYTLK